MSGKAGSGEVEPQRLVSDDELERYRVDGAVALRGHFAPWVERLRAATERVLEHPGPLGTRYGKDSHRGTFRGDRYMWTFDPDFRDFALSGPGARLAGELMDASSTRLFYDHLLVKEPGAEAPTPWHQDLPYWCVDGEQICSLWIVLDRVERDSGLLQFVRGSHRWNRRFRAPDFSHREDFSSELEPMPDIDGARGDYEILEWDALEPGDALAFHAQAIHGAPGNSRPDLRRRALSVRWMGDGVRYREHPRVTRPIRDPGLKDGDPVGGELFPQVWTRPGPP
ncbi:phytanoyl-CoA dioxygenase family protein [Burkholderia multivorans]|uniref:phytanoyl-CoA dioxygenase family protein n=1 Tax=Burkholderia multivorans TaxID=87883 RepID=UPI001C2330E7|nr:phytanoyl-CoA dioxygenase family protein [Burkholderia multivorans]MBU9651088.1 phytanoyl-CoA dioxygenase family protein [Burkholderia multivorans]